MNTNDKSKALAIDVDSYMIEDIPNSLKRRKNVKQFMVLDHFQRLKSDPKDLYVKFKYCEIVYACHSNRKNTRTMKHHLKNCKKYPYRRKKETKPK